MLKTSVIKKIATLLTFQKKTWSYKLKNKLQGAKNRIDSKNDISNATEKIWDYFGKKKFF